MIPVTRGLFLIASLCSLTIAGLAGDLDAHEALIPGGGEIVISSGQTDGSFVVAGTGRKYITRCFDLGGSVVAVPATGPRSELFFTTEMRRGFWYCCIPRYYINYLYVSLGAGSYSRMGKARRENGFALSGGTGLRIGVFGGFILNAEIKGYTIFKNAGTEEKMVFLLGAGVLL